MSRRLQNFLLTAAFSLLFCHGLFCYGAAEALSLSEIRGPRIEELSMLIIANPDAQIMAAEAGEIDIISDIGRPSDIRRLSAGKKLNMSLARGFHAFFLVLNNTVSPWNNPAVRRAAAMSIDRNAIVRMVFSGYCEPINSWLPPVSPWALPDSNEDIYNPAAAQALLAKHGYKKDITGFLTDSEGKRLPVIKLLTPLARVAPTTAELAGLMADSLRAAGFPAEAEPIDFSTMIAKMDRKEYSAAVLAWSMGVTPSSLYSFYHSSMSVEGGYNISGIKDQRLDRALEQLRFAPDKAAAQKASETSQRLLLELMPTIPVYSRISVAGVSKRWKNVFATDKMTADNLWTYLTIEPADGKKRPLVTILPEEPRSLNPLTASTAYAWQVLGMIYETMLGTDPETLENMPSLAESWKVETKGKGKNSHTELSFRLKKGLLWNDGTRLTARDIKATADFLRENKIPRFFDSVKAIKKVEATDERTLKFTMNGVSYWYLNDIGGLPCMPEKVIKGIKNWQSWNPLDKKSDGPYGLVGTGPFVLKDYKAGEYVTMKRNPHFRLLEGLK